MVKVFKSSFTCYVTGVKIRTIEFPRIPLSLTENFICEINNEHSKLSNMHKKNKHRILNFQILLSFIGHNKNDEIEGSGH